MTSPSPTPRELAQPADHADPAPAVGDVKPDDAPPTYDPAVHVDPDEWVYVQMFCLCGSVHRQRDPLRDVLPYVAAFLARHDGAGHGPASKADCIAEREARREAAFRVQGRTDEYAPKEHPSLNTECTKPRPWPQVPAEVLALYAPAPARSLADVLADISAEG